MKKRRSKKQRKYQRSYLPNPIGLLQDFPKDRGFKNEKNNNRGTIGSASRSQKRLRNPALTVRRKQDSRPVTTARTRAADAISKQVSMHKKKICRSRRNRRLTLFANNVIGKGKSGPKRRRYNINSQIKCR